MAHPHANTVPGRRERAHDLIGRTGNKAMARGGHSDWAADEKMVKSAVRQHEDNEHGGKHTKLKFASGGAIDGHAAHGHLGRRARGGSAGHGGGKKSTHVNVIVAPQGGGMRPAMPMAPGMGGGAPMPPRPPPAAPPPAAPPPGMPPGGMPPRPMVPPAPGMMPRPGGMKRGGGVQEVREEGRPSESLLQAKRGGRAKRDMGGIAGSGVAPSTPMPGAPTQGPMSQAQAQQILAQCAGQGMPMQKKGGATKHKRAEGGRVPHMEAGAGGAEGRIEKVREYGEGRGFQPKEHPAEFMLHHRDEKGRFTGGAVI